MTKGTLVLNGVDYSNGGLGGNPANNYSTEEQVIGTWIDGKPLYQKTVVFDNEFDVKNNEWKTLNIGNYYKAIINASVLNADNSYFPVMGGVTSNNGFSLSAPRHDGSIYVKILNIQYTKTTD